MAASGSRPHPAVVVVVVAAIVVILDGGDATTTYGGTSLIDCGDSFSAGVGERGPNRRSLAAIFLVEDDGHVVHLGHRLQFLARAIGRAVIDDDDFLLHGRGENGLEQLL